MRARPGIRFRSVALTILVLSSCPSLGAEPNPQAVADAAIITVVDATGSAKTVTPDLLAQLPAVPVTVSFESEHGARQASFEGPLLWTLLNRLGAVDVAAAREGVRQTLLISGRDGYTAVLALAEIAPAFEGKQVILAVRMNGELLEPGHFRIVVPGDRRGGRSVRDFSRVEIGQPQPLSH
jgi:hypothetical protein